MINKKLAILLAFISLSLVCVILCLIMWLLTNSLVNMILFFVILLAFILEMISLFFFYKNDIKEEDESNK